MYHHVQIQSGFFSSQMLFKDNWKFNFLWYGYLEVKNSISHTPTIIQKVNLL